MMGERTVLWKVLVLSLFLDFCPGSSGPGKTDYKDTITEGEKTIKEKEDAALSGTMKKMRVRIPKDLFVADSSPLES